MTGNQGTSKKTFDELVWEGEENLSEGLRPQLERVKSFFRILYEVGTPSDEPDTVPDDLTVVNYPLFFTVEGVQVWACASLYASTYNVGDLSSDIGLVLPKSKEDLLEVVRAVKVIVSAMPKKG